MSKTVPFQTIQFIIRTLFNSNQPIERTLSGAINLGQSGTGSDGNEGVLRISQSSSIIGAPPSDCLVSYPRLSLLESYPSADTQSVYSAAPADLVNLLEIQQQGLQAIQTSLCAIVEASNDERGNCEKIIVDEVDQQLPTTRLRNEAGGTFRLQSSRIFAHEYVCSQLNLHQMIDVTQTRTLTPHTHLYTPTPTFFNIMQNISTSRSSFVTVSSLDGYFSEAI